MVEHNSSFVPVVSEATIDAIRADYGEGQTSQSWGERLTQMQQKLLESNPHLVEFLEARTSNFPAEFHVPIFEVVCGILVLLERQHEADTLNRRLG